MVLVLVQGLQDHVNDQAKSMVRKAQLTKGEADLDTPCPVRVLNHHGRRVAPTPVSFWLSSGLLPHGLEIPPYCTSRIPVANSLSSIPRRTGWRVIIFQFQHHADQCVAALTLLANEPPPASERCDLVEGNNIARVNDFDNQVWQNTPPGAIGVGPDTDNLESKESSA